MHQDTKSARLIAVCKRTTPCLYADDSDIFSYSYDFTKLIGNLYFDLNNIRSWLVKNKLQHHPSKSKRMFIGSSCNLNNKVCDNSVLLNNVPISRTGTVVHINVKASRKIGACVYCYAADTGL